MDPSHLAHVLSQEEKRQFAEQGYLTIKGALPPAELNRLEAACDRVWRDEQARDLGPDQNLFYPNFVGREQVFVDLLDHPRTFPKVWGLLNSWNIYLYHSHLGVTPQEAPADTPVKRPLGFHQDSGRVNVELRTFPTPRLSLKVAYFLTDVSEPGRGNFYIIPGSHLTDRVPPASEVGRDPREHTTAELPAGAVPICVPPGTAVLFDRRLWHSRGANHSALTRKVLFYGYGYRWIRPKDDMRVEHLYERLTPIRRQLLGDAVKNAGRYAPADDDVPLRTWLTEHLGADTVAAMD